MIIFYQKKDGIITGTIDGRVHPDEHLKAWIGDKETTERYIVPFEPNFTEEEIPIKEFRVIDKKTMRVEEVIVGKKKQKVIKGLKPSVPFANLIYDFESGKKNIYDYKVKLDKENKVVGFIEK